MRQDLEEFDERKYLSYNSYHFEKKIPSTGGAEQQLDFVCWVPKERWTANK